MSHLGHHYGPTPTNEELGISQPTKKDGMVRRVIRKLLDSNLSEDNIWFVLSALRGPDTADPSGTAKDATTAVIRHHLGLSGSGDNGEINPFITNPDDSEHLHYRNENDILADSFHFTDHAKRAFEALGLEWDRLNK